MRNLSLKYICEIKKVCGKPHRQSRTRKNVGLCFFFCEKVTTHFLSNTKWKNITLSISKQSIRFFHMFKYILFCNIYSIWKNKKCGINKLSHFSKIIKSFLKIFSFFLKFFSKVSALYHKM